MTPNEIACEAEAAAVLASLDEDLAAPIRGLPWQRRTTDESLLAIQQIRLTRRLIALLEQLQDSDQSGEARRNG